MRSRLRPAPVYFVRTAALPFSNESEDEFMEGLKKFYNNLEAHLLVISLIFTVILIFAQVILRYVFNSSLSWAEELARYIFIWQIWLGTSVAQRDRAHVRIEMFRSGRKKQVISVIADVVWLAFCLILIKYGAELVLSIYQRNLVSAAMKLPMYLVYLSLPVSQTAVAVRIIGELCGTVKEMRTGNVQMSGEGGKAV